MPLCGVSLHKIDLIGSGYKHVSRKHAETISNEFGYLVNETIPIQCLRNDISELARRDEHMCLFSKLFQQVTCG